MANTLVLYDGKMSTTERIADVLSYLIGNAMTAELSEAPADTSAYGNLCLVFNFYGTFMAGKTRQYLEANKEKIRGKQIAFIGIGLSDAGFGKYILDMQELIGCGEIASRFISGESQAIEAGHEIAKKLNNPERPMDDDTLMDSIRAYISAHNTLALATSAGQDVRCTPLEYHYADGVFYIFTEGGSKFRGLLQNDRVSAAVFDPYSGFGSVHGLQITGRAQVIPFMSKEYEEAAQAANLSAEMLDRLPFHMILIRITPYVYEFLNADFAKNGFDQKQHYVTDFKKKSLQR